MSGGVARVELDASPEFLLGGYEVPVEAIEAECQRGVRFTERVVQLERLGRRGLGRGKRLAGGITAYCQSPSSA